MTLFAPSFIFGKPSERPVIGLEGKVRLCLREGHFAVAIQKTATGFARWMLTSEGEYWKPFGLMQPDGTVIIKR